MVAQLPICPACEAEIEIDDLDVDRGETIGCPECGVTLSVVRVSPIELDIADEEVREWRITRPMTSKNVQAKQARLQSLLEDMGSVLVAFSGGVDSSYLAVEAHRTLGDRVLAVTGESPSYPEYQRTLALQVVHQFEIPHRFIGTEEIHNASYLANSPDRCFHCKNELYTRLKTLARKERFQVIVDGANADDLGDYRPGRNAAKLAGVRSPLEEAELTKAEIRTLSRGLGLPTADEPASACLSSRIPYHTPITIENLSTVEKGEAVLRRLGFRHMRVRHHDALVRLEFSIDELPRALSEEMRAELTRELKALGYKFVTIDLEGYRTGSLNEVL